MTNEDSLIFTIGPVHVAEEVLDVWFRCHTDQCHGVCCATDQASAGAPLTDTEYELLHTHRARLIDLLPQPNSAALQARGPAYRKDIRYFTQSLPNSTQCLFASHQQGCYQCLLQHPSVAGELQKPVSCSLFPIRELRTEEGNPLLVLEYWNECAPGYDHGEATQTLVYQAMRQGLVQRFGEAFYQQLDWLVQSGEFDRMVDAAEA